jgi:hypothetical protein
MAEYQIRIIERGGHCAAYSCQCGSVFAAVRRAKTIATSSDSIEVWSEMECVFYDHRDNGLPERAGQNGEPA